MIVRENYGEAHIRELQVGSKCDPGLIERALFAFGLLEALSKVGLSFTFKGGTSLLLLLSADALVYRHRHCCRARNRY